MSKVIAYPISSRDSDSKDTIKENYTYTLKIDTLFLCGFPENWRES